MTFDEFCDEIRALQKKWRITEDGRIRCEDSDCPLVVLQIARGRGVASWSPHVAALNLGCSRLVADTIANIADSPDFRPPEAAKLLSALGL